MQEIILAVSVIIAVMGLCALVHNYAVASIGEMKYMLRCAKSRQQLYPSEEGAEIIQRLEEKLQNYWGWKILKKEHVSIFDYKKTP